MQSLYCEMSALIALMNWKGLGDGGCSMNRGGLRGYQLSGLRDSTTP